MTGSRKSDRRVELLVGIDEVLQILKTPKSQVVSHQHRLRERRLVRLLGLAAT